MELYQLKTFVAVAEEGHLTRAAERLHASQPSVSGHIRALEDELGLTLFERTPKGMRLTAAGAVLKTKAESVLKAADALRYAAMRQKGELNGELRLGLHIEPRWLKIGELLSAMQSAHPGVELHYLQCMTWEAPEELLAGRLDAAFVNRVPDDEAVVAHKLETLELAIVGPLAWQDRLQNADWQAITALPWVWLHSLCPLYEVAESLFEEKGLVPIKAVITDQEATLRNLVASGVGLTLMLSKEARKAKDDLFIVQDKAGSVDLSFIYLKKRAADPLIRAILRVIRSLWEIAAQAPVMVEAATRSAQVKA
jgi:DNA-binding transcriptional LysR family regulator